MVGVEGVEPTFDAISRTNYESTVYKTASLHSYTLKGRGFQVLGLSD